MLEIDGVRADYIELDPYELDIPPLADRPVQSARLMLSIILEGHSTGEVDGHPLVLSSTQAAILDGRAAMRFRSEVPVKAVRLFVDADHLRADVLQCPTAHSVSRGPAETAA